MTNQKVSSKGFYDALKSNHHNYSASDVSLQIAQTDKGRVIRLSDSIAKYMNANLPHTIDRRETLFDYRTNPYVLLASASLMGLSIPRKFAEFLFNNKLYMGLETSFGKSIEDTLVGGYPINAVDSLKWATPKEKIAESKALEGLKREDKAKRRNVSVWREIDKSCLVGNRRYLITVKSGPNCINDTQVEAMKTAIATHHRTWFDQTKTDHPGIEGIDIVIGLTYGTDRTTNNKENQILVKLLDHGFKEENRKTKPGVLIDSRTGTVRVYRQIGQEFWGFIGNPVEPRKAHFVYLEVLLALARAFSMSVERAGFEEQVNLKLVQLSKAISKLAFPRSSLPSWIRDDFSEDELFWLATGLTAFFDEGI